MQYLLNSEQAFFLKDKDLLAFMSFFMRNNIDIYVVGGAVRNALLGLSKPCDDIDLAVSISPEEAIIYAKKFGAKIIPTGIDHGTITVVIHGKSYEMTSFRKDIKTDGRHAKVIFSGTLKEDAQRRDFGLNAIYCDPKGEISTPLKESLEDIKTKTIRFIGDITQRIREDYLRILRYYRFCSIYPIPSDIHEVSCIIKQEIKNMKRPSEERNITELDKLISGKNTALILNIMQDYQIDVAFFTLCFDINTLEEMIKKTQCHGIDIPDFIKKFILLGQEIKDEYHFKRTEKSQLKKILTIKSKIGAAKDMMDLYMLKYDIDINMLVILYYLSDVSILTKKNIQILQNTPLISLPFSPADIAKQGVKGRAIEEVFAQQRKDYLANHLNW